MATSLEDETQQPSLYGQFSSPPFGPSSQPSSPARPLRRSSPVSESSIGGFLYQQRTLPGQGQLGDVEDSIDSIRESEVGRGAQAVVAGNLLRVGMPGSSKRPGGSTIQAMEQGLISAADRRPLLGDEEVDELDAPLPAPRGDKAEDEPASIPSPADSPPPPPQTGPVTRKRKETPSASSSRTTPIKSAAGQKPISAHSPAHLHLSTSTRPTSTRTMLNPLPTPPVTALPLPARNPFLRTTSKAKKQKVVQEEPDSFAESHPVYRPREKPSEFFGKLMSEAELEIPKEMQSSNGGLDDTEAEDTREQGDPEDENFSAETEKDGGGAIGEEDGGDSHALVGEGGASLEAEAKVGDSCSVRKPAEDVAEETHLPSSSSGDRILIPASSESAAMADISVESILFSTSGSQPALRIEETQQSTHSLPPSSIPANGATQASLPTSQPALPIMESNVGYSLIGAPRRGFANVGMSQTQGDSPNSSNIRVDRRELFSSPGEAIGSSQAQSQSQAWSNFAPTQVRAASDVMRGSRGDESLEPTQMVSEESHQRAQDVLAERRGVQAAEERNMEIDQGLGDGGYTQLSTQPGGTQEAGASGESPSVQMEDTQQVSEESLERAQDLWRARKELEDRERREALEAHIKASENSVESETFRIETLEATYQSRRSDNESTQLVSPETQRRTMDAIALANDSNGGGRASSPALGSEAPRPIIPAHRRLERRRNIQETQSAPQPLLALPSFAPSATAARSRTDPVPEPSAGRLTTPPRASIPKNRQLRRTTTGRTSEPSIQIQVDVDMGSPAQGPSSSMQEAEDLLQLGVITQATNDARSQSRSASPPPMRASARRSTRTRVLHTSSPSASPPSPIPARRRSSPLEFSPSHRATPAAAAAEVEPTFPNPESVETLPQPTKPPSPLQTYGTRKRGAHVSPARPPSFAAEPVVEIPIPKGERKRRREEEDPQTGEITTPKSGRRKRGRGNRNAKVRGQDEDDDDSPDPLASPIIHKAAEEDRMEVDEKSEPASPPTPQDTEDFSYRPIAPLRTSTTSITTKAGKKTSAVAAPSPSRPQAKKSTLSPSTAKTKGRKVFSAITGFPKSALSRDTFSTEVSTSTAKQPKNLGGKKGGLISAGAKSKSAQGSTSTILTAAPTEDLSELSEPESPPTPQDPEDETFKLTKKGTGSTGKVGNGKKRTSRQNSSTTSVSAAPRRAKAPLKSRKSNLSSTTDELALPTPTYTSQRSMTEQGDDDDDGDEDEEEDISDRPHVFAYYKINKSYYPCQVIARHGHSYRIRYLDGEEGTARLEEMRQYVLKAGDKIKFDIASMRKRTDLEVGEDWSDGDGAVRVRNKDGVSAGEFEIHLLKCPLSTVNLRFDDRKVTSRMFADIPEEEQDEEELAAELAKRSTASLAPKVKTGTNTFADKVFLITPTDDSTSILRSTIEKNGGLLCDWSDLFAATQFGQPLKAELGRTPFLITPDIDSGKAGMKVKGMIALSFGIPCLAPDYVDAAMADPSCDWIPYAIATGTSAFTSNPALQFIDESWGSPGWSIRNARNRRRPLANMRVLFMNLNTKVVELEKIVGTCVFGLGAISFNTTSLTADIKDDTYDLLIISNNSDKGAKKKDLPLSVRGNKKAGDVQWLKQCMVSGARPPMRLYSY